MTGTQMEHVIFKETTQLYTRFPQATSTLRWAAPPPQALYRAGKLRLLAWPRPSARPSSPTPPPWPNPAAPDFAVTGWNAIAVPPGLPAAVTDKIKRDIEQALTGPDVTEKFKTFGYEPLPTTRAQFDQFVPDEASALAM